MPAFPARQRVAQAGHAEQAFACDSEEPQLDPEKAKVGESWSRRMAVFCFSCHAIGSLKPAQVFDAQGINLAKVGDRLLPGTSALDEQPAAGGSADQDACLF